MSFESKSLDKKIKVTLEIEIEVTSVDFWDELKDIDDIFEGYKHCIPESVKNHLVGDLLENDAEHVAYEDSRGWEQIQFTITDIDSSAEFMEE